MIYGILLVLGASILYVIATYNAYQTAKTRIKASIQEIGNQLKRQFDLIPNLESSVKGYLKHEKGIFEKLTEARKAVAAAVKSGTMAKAADAASALQALIPALQVVVEDNPELKANETIAKLMDELRDTADKVMYARRTLIDLAADLNRMLVTFPSNLIAKMFGFTPEPGLATAMEGEHLTVSQAEMKSPKVRLE
jgi:LemA protein